MTPEAAALQAELADWRPLLALLIGYAAAVVALFVFGRGKRQVTVRAQVGTAQLDKDVTAIVTRVLQTVAGRMIFAQPRLE